MGIHQSTQQQTQNNENIILKRTQKPYHNLYSPRDQHKEFVWKKWKFQCIESAHQQLRRLNKKINESNQFITAILDTQLTKTNQGVYKVRAKIQFSEKNLKKLVEEKIRKEKQFVEADIWAIVGRLVDIAVFLQEKGGELPRNLSSYLKIGNKFKIVDTQFLPQIKCTKDKSSYGQIISKIATDLALLNLSSSEVTLMQINRINLKFSVNLATLIYCLKQQNLTTQQIQQLWHKLYSQPKQLIYRSSTLASSTQPMQKLSPILSLNKNTHTTTHTNLQPQLQISRIGDKRIKKSTSENMLPYRQSSKNAKRIQQICPKNYGNIVQINVLKQKQRQTQNRCQQKQIGNGENLDGKDFDKENEDRENWCNQNKGNGKMITSQQDLAKSSLQIENHHFPKKLKQFKRRSTTASQLNLDSANSESRNQAFIKLTGGSRCQLFAQDGDDQLLQSIIESEQSIIIKDNESPLLSLDQQMDQIAQDFLKLQSSFNTAQKEEVKSVIQFMYQRNSTIMEVTEESQQSGSGNIKISGIKNNPDEVSKFEIEQENQQRKHEESFVDNKDENQLSEEKFVIEQYEGGSKYQGYILHGLRNGFGKLYYQDGGSYEGSWKNGEIQGFGKLYYQSGDLAYQGYWSQGQFHGQGKIINQKPQQIQGSFNFTDFSQVGTAWIWYEGNFQNDHKNGYGTLMLSNGQKLTSEWKKNNVDGQGTFVTIFKRKIRGKWKNNILEEIYEDQIEHFDDIQIS